MATIPSQYTILGSIYQGESMLYKLEYTAQY